MRQAWRHGGVGAGCAGFFLVGVLEDLFSVHTFSFQRELYRHTHTVVTTAATEDDPFYLTHSEGYTQAPGVQKAPEYEKYDSLYPKPCPLF